MPVPRHVLMDEAGNGGGDGGGGGGGTPDPHWSESLELGDLANETFIREAPDLATFAKSALDAHRYATGSLRVPSEHASVEERQAFRDKLREHVPTLVELDMENPDSYTAVRRSMGLPEESGGYEVPSMDVGDYGPPNLDQQVEFFREVAHANGLTNDQFKGVLKAFAERSAGATKVLSEQKAEAIGALKKDWGSAYDQKVSAAKAAAEATNAPAPLIEAIDAGQVDADSLRWLADLHDKLGGASALDGGKEHGANTGAMTPSEAEYKLEEIRRNPEHPYWKASDPKHAWAVKEYQRLTRIALGEEADKPAGLDQYVEPVPTLYEGRV